MSEVDGITDLTKRGCDNCPFRGKKIGPRGPKDAKFVIVGESPGAEELAKGMPFMGPSGKMLEGNLPDDLEPYITNALSCMPVKKDTKVLANAVSCCRQRLLDELAEHPRDTILCLGNGAAWAVTGNYNLKITQERGKRFETPLAKNGCVVTVHPAFLLRGGGSYKKFQEDIQLAIAIHEGREIKKYIEPKVVVVTEDMVANLKIEMAEQTYIASDIETSGFSRRQDKILSTGFCWDPALAYIVPADLIHHFKEEMENEAIRWIWQNGKFDASFLREKGIQARVDEDSMLLNYCLDETRGVHDLDTIASDVLGAPNHKKVIDDWFNHQGIKKDDRSYEMLPLDILYPYQGYDLSKTLQIFNVLRPRVAADPALEKLYTKTLLPASELLLHIENRGFLFDWDMWEANKVRLTEKVGELLAEIQEIAGFEINPNSPKQMVKLLFDDLKIPTKIRSTNKDVIKKLPRHPIILALEKYRKATKALSTYVIGMAKVIENDGRAHTTFLLHGTRTGRLASRHPNLQNIPRDPLLRGMFRASPGYILVDLDASQAELRSLAIQSGDPDLIAIFNSTDRSMHKEVAIAIFGPDYTEDDYVKAKAINFGIIYGKTAFSFAEEWGISVKQAQKYIDDWLNRFPKARDFINKCRAAPLKRQTLVTVFGRKCRPGLVSRENQNAVQNEFSNFPHQSTASDITLHVAIRIKPMLDQLGAYIVNLVHDSIVIEVPENPETIKAVEDLGLEYFPKVAAEWGLTKVPFKSESKLYRNWGNKM